MDSAHASFEEAASFHGHVCPGLAMGFRVAVCAIRELDVQPGSSDIVSVVENRSCAVDAIQVVTGCTYGKGNLVVNDFGKQVYILAKRPTGEGVRIAVKWTPPPESKDDESAWRKYMQGDRSQEVVGRVNICRAAKVNSLFAAPEEELFELTRITLSLPEKARVYPTKTCSSCGEKVMEPMALVVGEGEHLCVPCYKK